MDSVSASSCRRSGLSHKPISSKWHGLLLEPPLCGCELQACLRTSLTGGNPGQRFYGCPMYSGSSKQRGCNFFQWVDPPTCKRGQEFLPSIITKKRGWKKKPGS